MKNGIKFFLSLQILVLFCIPIFSSVTLASRINKDKIRFEESFTFTLRFEGLKSPIEQPSLPEINGGIVKGQYQTVESFKEGYSYLYHYIISPLRSGTIKLSDFSIKVENQTLKVKGFQVEVVEEKKIQSTDQIQPQKLDFEPEVFLEGRISKSECYEGEAVIYTLHLLTRESVRNFEFVEKPNFDGFRKIELPFSRYPKTSKVERKNKLFLDAVVYKSVLVSLKSGLIEISPFVSDIKLQSSIGTSRIVRLKGGEAKVSVLPLTNLVKGFKGCIGSFKVNVSAPKEIHSKVNELLSIEIDIEGEGVLSSEPFVVPQSPFFESYPLKVEDHSEEIDGKFISKKKFTLSFTPLVAGKRSLPEIPFVYFDTKKRVFETTNLKFPLIVVSEGTYDPMKKKISILPPISTLEKYSPKKENISVGNLYLLSIPFIFTLTIFIFWSFLEKLFLSPEKIKYRKLEQKAFKELKRAKNYLDTRTSKDFHSHLRKSVESFIEIIIDEPVSSLTQNSLEEKLTNKNFSQKDIENIINLINEIDSSEFSLEKTPKNELKKRWLKAESLLKGKKSVAKSFIFLLLILFYVVISAEDPTDILFKKGYNEQVKGNYNEAIRYYKMVEDYGKAFPVLYYNLGNAYFENGNIPYAIFYFKKSLKLDPTLTSAQTNLSICQSLLKSRISPYELSPFKKFLLSTDSKIFFYLSFILIVLANLIFSILKIIGSLSRRSFLVKIALFIMALGFIFSFLFYKSDTLRNKFREAVVLERSEVYVKPVPTTKTSISLPEGSLVYLSEISGEWAKIKWGEGEGYVPSSSLGEI